MLVGGGLAAAFLLAGRVWSIPARVSTDPDEGWNAFHAVAAMAGRGLYPAPGGLIGDNYPPLSFYLVGMVARLTGDAIVAGRILSLIAILAVTGMVAVAVKRLSPRGAWAPALGALLFLAYNATAYRRYVAMDDPQWLGHAFMTGGLLMLLSGAGATVRWRPHVIVAALLMVCGGFIKHNLVAFPIGTTLWLALRDRRGLAVWTVAGGIAAALAAGACLLAYGPDFLRDIGGAARTYSAARMLHKSRTAVPILLPLVIASLPLLRGRSRSGACLLVVLIATLAVPLGLIQRSGAGVDINAHFEALIALCILAPVGLASIADRHILQAGLVVLAAPVAVIMPAAVRADIAELSGRDADVAAVRPIINTIARVPGPVACADQALCYWAGKGFALDVFLTGQGLVSGGDVRPLRKALDSQRFGMIELDSPEYGKYDTPIVALIRRRYRPISDDGDRQLWVPQ